MPPLLAAFLMLELGCDLRIIQAIDLMQEWRRYCEKNWHQALRKNTSEAWYEGAIGEPDPKVLFGTFVWPSVFSHKDYVE